jgi:non-specific protein-tyrosine kinase
LLASQPVLDGVIARLGLALTAEDLAKKVRVELVRDTQLIKVHVEYADPVWAAAIAHAIPEVFRALNQAQQASRFAESKQSLQAEIDALDQQLADLQAQLARLAEASGAEAQAGRDRLQEELAQLRQTRASLVQSYENLRLAEAQSISNVVLVEDAGVPRRPIRPRTLQNTALAAVVGLMLAVGVAFLVEYLDDTLKSPAQVTEVLGLPVIGVLARQKAKDLAGGPIARREPRSPFTEAYRSLRTNLQFASVDRPLRRLLVTSVAPGEGKSMVVANLGLVLAQTGQRVVVVDADLRRPMQHTLLGKLNRFGLTEALVQDSLQLNGAMQPVEAANLHLVSTGSLPPNPAELLGSKKMAGLLGLIGEQADTILVDSPPVTAVTDAVILAGQVDGVILVIEAGKTRIGAALQAKEQFERVGARVVGVVLNKIPIRRDGYYYNHYYNNHEYSDNGHAHHRRPLWRRLFKRRHASTNPNGHQPEADAERAEHQGA